MSASTIDAQLMARMFLSGARNLELNKEWINELNVFPVPDGDTGTNMTMTILSAAGEVENLSNVNMDTLAKAISSGSLRGARGNSGVILSQLLRGFTKTIKGKTEIDQNLLADALQRAVETAYKAVMKPKEGTILTVARAAADKARELIMLEADQTMEFDEFISKILEEGKETLARTPEMLPVLKEAGVVDSGGQGLICVLEGAYLAFIGKDVVSAAPAEEKEDTAAAAETQTQPEIKFGYCTEFIIVLEKAFGAKDEEDLKGYLTSIGDSIVCVADEEIVKIHVHTNDPGLALQKALTYGSLTKIKIDNMREENQEKLAREAEKLAAMQAEADAKKAGAQEENKPYGFISVSVGEGIAEIFRELGVDYLIEGGQTMNPSTEDMLKAIDQVHADTIFILPNNKNIVLAANQARDLVEDKKIIVIPTRTIPQGIAAVINFVAEMSAEDNEEAMKEAIGAVKTAQLTYAVRDTHIDDKEIHENDIMAVGDDGIIAVGKEIHDVALAAIKEMADEDSELISLYYGADYPEEEAQALAEEIGELYGDCDVEVNEGGQPIYYCIISVE